MDTTYQLDSLLQDINVSNARKTLGRLDPGISPRRSIINVSYSTDRMNDSVNYHAQVFDQKRGYIWQSLDGPQADFLRFFAWYDDTLSRYSSVGRTVYGFRSYHNEIRLHMLLYTHTNRYSITGHVNLMDDGNYLGCTASSRAPRPGEHWTRGSDLADGSYSRDTWNRIIGDILGYELLDRQCHQDKVWGLFPDDEPGQGHSHERRLGYAKLGHDRISANGAPYTEPDGPLTPFQL